MSNLGIIGLYTKGFYHIINTLNYTKFIFRFVKFNKADVDTKKKCLLHPASLLFSLLLRILESNISHDLTNRQFVKMLIS